MLAFFTILLAEGAGAQVRLNLGYVPDTRTYTVSILPETSWSSPQNMVASGQVVLKVASGTEFIPGITTLLNGLVWSDNAYIENPQGMDGYTLVCIALVNGPTSKIKFEEGQEVPLFSFVNTGGTCPGLVELIDNSDPAVQEVRASGFNVTQNLAVLGAHGNAITGIANGSVDCSLATGVVDPSDKMLDHVKISPVPADRSVNIQWTMLTDRSFYKQMVICDAQGKEVFRQTVSGGKGPQSIELNVNNWKSGLYRVRFVFDNGQSTQSWNFMIIH